MVWCRKVINFITSRTSSAAIKVHFINLFDQKNFQIKRFWGSLIVIFLRFIFIWDLSFEKEFDHKQNGDKKKEYN